MKKILLIDDHAALRNIMSYDLKSEGYEIFCAPNPIEGLEIAKDHFPDLILMDMMMPTMDGLSGIKLFKSNDLVKNIPIITVTARTKESELKKAISYGAIFCIIKPFKFSEILQKIKEILS